MPNKPKRRGYRKYLRGKIEFQLDLGTLGSKTLIGGVVSGAVIERTFVSSIVASYSLAEFTDAIGDGPIMVGVAHSDYTDAEIEAFIENSGSWNAGNLTAQEVAKRKVKIIGVFESSVADSSGIETLQDGRMIKTKLNWILITAQNLRFWAYNAGLSAIATTQPEFHVDGHANLWPTG